MSTLLFSAALQDLFEDTVIAQPGVFDSFGAWLPSGAAISVTCRCKGGEQKVWAKGTEVVSTVHFVTDGIYGLNEDMQFTLPSDFITAEPFAVRIYHIRDENGPQHEKVFMR